MNPTKPTKGVNLLRYSSIVLMMLGVTQLFQCIALIGGLIYMFTDAQAVKDLTAAGANIPMMIVSMTFSTLLVIFQGVTGFFGLRSMDNPKFMKTSLILGIILSGLEIVNCGLSLFGGSEWNATSILNLILNLALPILFVVSVIIYKKEKEE